MFSKILYINLERRPDRKNNIEDQLRKIDNKIKVERINAIDAKKLDIASLSNKIISKNGINAALDNKKGLYTILTKGAVGCALSHKLAWEKILNGPDEHVLILEDDIWFDGDYNNKLVDIMKNIDNYDILFLGAHKYTPSKELKYFDVPNILYGLFGYVINKKAARILLSLFPITEQIDTEMSRVFDKLKVRTVKYNHMEDDRIILSDLSQESYTFGTDIQHRDYFPNTNNKSCNMILFLIVFIIIIFGLYLRNIKKNELITN